MLGPPFLLFAFVRFSMIPLPLLNERTFWMTPIDVKKSYESIGSKGAKALLSYHAFSGGDFTCKFNGKSKLTTWRHFNSSSDAVLDAFSQLGSPDLSILDETTAKLQANIMNLYCEKRHTPSKLLEDCVGICLQNASSS